jgi:hypothetical protein
MMKRGLIVMEIVNFVETPPKVEILFIFIFFAKIQIITSKFGQNSI